MKSPPTPGRDERRLEDLLARSLELYEGEGALAVDAFLREHAEDAAFVRQRLDVLGMVGLLDPPPEHALPESVGGYRITGLLGRGGMGVVYEAEQSTPRRRVALKVLRTHSGSRGFRRFRDEAELLARLQHPGIARVYDAGTDVVGGVTVPYLAMELIEGVALDAWARSSGLDVRGRVALLARIADAVHHAHQKGVVHRDLKPSNILVEPSGTPRIVDFGVARKLDGDGRSDSLLTQAGEVVGTLAYMSPEQTTGGPGGVDSQADVYSLGAVAYELLSGHLPFELPGKSMLEALETIRDEEPRPLGAWDPTLAGDLAVIVDKALAKERSRRYASAHELGTDLRRFLDDQPVAARPATASYYLRKFARRHRVLVASALVVAASLVVGSIGLAFGIVKATQERDEADRRLRQAAAVRSILGEMFARADPTGDGVQVVDLLDTGSRLADEAGYGTLEEAAVAHLLGEAYAAVGAIERAEPLLLRAARLYEEHLGEGDVSRIGTQTRLAQLFAYQGRLDEAEAALEGVVAASREALGATHEATLSALHVQAVIANRRGRHAEAERGLTWILERLAPDDPLLVTISIARARARIFLGDLHGSAADAREALALARAAFGSEHVQTLLAMEMLGTALQSMNRLEEGGELLEEVLEIRRKRLGPEHPETLAVMVELSRRYYGTGDHERAAELLRDGYEVAQRVLPATHPTRRMARNALTLNLMARGANAEAEEILWAQLEEETQLNGPDHLNTISVMANLAVAIEAQGRSAEALEIMLEALAATRESASENHPTAIDLLYNIGASYANRFDRESADRYYAEAVAKAGEHLAEGDLRRARFAADWALNLGHLGRREEARAALETARRYAAELEEGHPERARVRSAGETLERQGSL